jgi:hypothetical protein
MTNCRDCCLNVLVSLSLLTERVVLDWFSSRLRVMSQSTGTNGLSEHPPGRIALHMFPSDPEQIAASATPSPSTSSTSSKVTAACVLPSSSPPSSAGSSESGGSNCSSGSCDWSPYPAIPLSLLKNILRRENELRLCEETQTEYANGYIAVGTEDGADRSIWLMTTERLQYRAIMEFGIGRTTPISNLNQSTPTLTASSLPPSSSPESELVNALIESSLGASVYPETSNVVTLVIPRSQFHRWTWDSACVADGVYQIRSAISMYPFDVEIPTLSLWVKYNRCRDGSLIEGQSSCPDISLYTLPKMMKADTIFDEDHKFDSMSLRALAEVRALPKSILCILVTNGWCYVLVVNGSTDRSHGWIIYMTSLASRSAIFRFAL